MRFRIISASKIREPFYVEGIREYLKRLRPFISIEIVEGYDEKWPPNASPAQIEGILEKEAQRILNLVKPEEVLIVLDRQGRMLSSEDLALRMQDLLLSGKPRINWVVGSAAGIAESLKKRANLVFSFSPLTLPHQMAVLILTEQIYRSFKIIKNEPYHH